MPSAKLNILRVRFFCTPIIAYLQRVTQTDYRGGKVYEYQKTKE